MKGHAPHSISLLVLALITPIMIFANSPQATVIDSGSTNRAGMRVTFDEGGHATVDVRGGQPRHIKLSDSLCKQLLQALRAAGPLSDLPTRHCMKSASFGSSLYVEANGERSPDLNCPDQLDQRADALQKSAKEILKAAQEVVGVQPGRRFNAPGPPYPPR